MTLFQCSQEAPWGLTCKSPLAGCTCLFVLVLLKATSTVPATSMN
ncbi:hypothetical protein HanIR_Chr02g0081951 [Helianthus annuus]|nr:hypothetical protein HanIR_Chr02g0081951 [Helianthus annuus]